VALLAAAFADGRQVLVVSPRPRVSIPRRYCERRALVLSVVAVTRLFDFVMVFVYRVPLLDCLTGVSQGFLGILVVGDYRLGRCEIGQPAEERAHVIILVTHGDQSRAETHDRDPQGQPASGALSTAVTANATTAMNFFHHRCFLPSVGKPPDTVRTLFDGESFCSCSFWLSVGFVKAARRAASLDSFLVIPCRPRRSRRSDL
jgi:hypothetical protein